MLKWTTRRPMLRLYGSWDGDNLTELEEAMPDWTFHVNADGTLHARSGSGEFETDVSIGHWFTYDAYYEVDPTTTDLVQDAPGPGRCTFNLTAD